MNCLGVRHSRVSRTGLGIRDWRRIGIASSRIDRTPELTRRVQRLSGVDRIANIHFGAYHCCFFRTVIARTGRCTYGVFLAAGLSSYRVLYHGVFCWRHSHLCGIAKAIDVDWSPGRELFSAQSRHLRQVHQLQANIITRDQRNAVPLRTECLGQALGFV